MIITLNNINANSFSSLQIGDILHFQELSILIDEAGDEYKQTQGAPVQIGVVSSITNGGDIVIDNPQVLAIPGESYLFFVKPANKASVRGYYMDVTMTNSKGTRAELFGVTTNIAESSK